MQPNESEEKLLYSGALQTANTVRLARRRAEQELLEAKQELERKTKELAHSLAMMRATLESTTDGILVTDYDGQVTGYNQQFVEMWRLPPEVLRAGSRQRPRDVASSQVADPSSFLARIEQIYQERPPETHDLLEFADGRVIERVSKTQRIGDRNVGRVWSFRDITQRIRAETKLRQQTQWFSVTLGSIGDAVITADNDCRVTFLNSVAEGLSGWRTSEAMGCSINDVLHLIEEKTRERATNPIESALADVEVKVLPNHTILVRPDGAEIPIEERAAPIKNPEGEIIGAVMVFHDVTERRQKEKALKEEYAITERLHEIAASISTELDLGKVVQTIIDAGTRVTRAQFGAFYFNELDEQGISCLRYVVSGVPRGAFEDVQISRATELCGTAFRDGSVIRLDDRRQDPCVGKKGACFGIPKGSLPASYLAVPVLSRSGEVVGGLFFGHEKPGVFTARDEKVVLGVAAQAAAAMDAARSYQAEQQARAAAEQANKAKDLFLAALSHELRTPLTPVLAILSSLRENAALPPAIAEDLETVRRNIELEARLIDDLLDLTRITRGKLELRCERVRLHRMIEDATSACLPELQAKHLNLVRDVANETATILADSARITQILWNLLKNAIKFTPEGGTITIRSRTKPADGIATVEIEDTGIGIGPGQLDRVFDAFEQGNRQITRQFGGIGLGLAISQAIAESHQGTLSVLSEGEGRGSTFRLALPFDGCDEDEITTTGTPNPVQSSTVPASDERLQRRLRILLVEDHADTAAVLGRLLHRMGYDVLAAGDFATALALVKKEISNAPIDVVISDLGLPDGSGLDLMRQLSTDYGLRGIALSGFGMDSDLKESITAGFWRHLVKPIDIGTLRATLVEMTNDA